MLRTEQRRSGAESDNEQNIKDSDTQHNDDLRELDTVFMDTLLTYSECYRHCRSSYSHILTIPYNKPFRSNNGILISGCKRI